MKLTVLVYSRATNCMANSAPFQTLIFKTSLLTCTTFWPKKKRILFSSKYQFLLNFPVTISFFNKGNTGNDMRKLLLFIVQASLSKKFSDSEKNRPEQEGNSEIHKIEILHKSNCNGPPPPPPLFQKVKRRWFVHVTFFHLQLTPFINTKMFLMRYCIIQRRWLYKSSAHNPEVSLRSTFLHKLLLLDPKP